MKASVLAVAVVMAVAARAQDEDLGGTSGTAPSAADLGVIPDDDGAAETPAPPTRRKVPAAPAPLRALPAADAVPALKADATRALAEEPGDARALDALAALLGSAEDLHAKAIGKLAKARALLLSERLDEMSGPLADARALAEGLPVREQRRVVAEVRYRQAEAFEATQSKRASCKLGLERLAVEESRVVRERASEAARRYRVAVKLGDRFWSRRAAFRTAVVYDDLYRHAVTNALGFRGERLPNPFALGKVDSQLLVADVLDGAWPAEISRLYSEVIAAIDVRDPDPALLALAQERATAFSHLEVPAGERATNPWLEDEKPGLVRLNGKLERRGADGRWVALDKNTAQPLLTAALATGPGTVEHAYALVALTEIGPIPPVNVVTAALEHKDARVKLAGLLAIERKPRAELVEPLVTLAASTPDHAPFVSLADALYGVPERALLALRAIAGAQRDVAEKLLVDVRLPLRERTWIVAELGDPQLQYMLQAFTREKDPDVAATALYGLYLAQGSKAVTSLRPSEPGAVGCVSRAIAGLDARSH